MKDIMSFSDSLLVTVIGMAIVFLGLTVLIFMIKLLSRLTERLGQKKFKPQVRQASSVPMPPVLPPRADGEEIMPEDDGALVAAITAALAVFMEEEGSAGGFTVRRIRRVVNQPAWARAGREEQLYAGQ